MRVHVVSDVHGNSEALARAGDGADALLVLGDLLNFVDYDDYRSGILGQIFGGDAVAEFARIRTVGTPNRLVEYARSLWARLDDPGTVLHEAVREQYRALFGALSAPTFVTPGNVDLPGVWPEFTGDGIRMLDGSVAEIGGLRFGFVGGLPLPPGLSPRSTGPWQPYARTSEEYAAATAALGQVDVLCSHVPPGVAELTYDVRSRRAEIGSVALLELIERVAPRAALFGHVHQPLAARVRIGRTECVNVGHFRRTECPFVFAW